MILCVCVSELYLSLVDEDQYVCQMYRDKDYEDVAIFSAFLEHKLHFSVSVLRILRMIYSSCYRN